MRLLSLLVTLLIVAYMVYAQLGSGNTPAAEAPYKRAEAKAAAVDDQVQDQFARQAEALSRMENGESVPAAEPSN